MGMIAHLLNLLSLIGPLVIYLVKKDESPFIRHHAAQALNLGLSSLIVTISLSLIGCVLSFVLIGIFVFFLLVPYGILVLVYMILAAVAANRGDWYKYPSWVAFPMIR